MIMPTPRGFYPSAVIKQIPPGANDPAIVPRLAILHVAVSESSSLFDFFNGPSGGIESHFYITRSGLVEQYRSIYFQADANLGANNFAVSVETQGMGAGEWTQAQLDAIKKLLRWLHREAGVPLTKCQAADGSGVGYHSQFRSWSPVVKTCPGPDRVQQFETVLVPWMNSLGVKTATKVTVARQAVTAAIRALREALPSRRGARNQIKPLKEVRNNLPKE
jgi:hypothetical protein